MSAMMAHSPAGNVQHRDAWLLLALLSDLENEAKWVIAALALLQPNPQATQVNVSDRKLTKTVNKLRRGALRWMEAHGVEQMPEQGAIILGLSACGWEPDYDGMVAELRRVGRDDVVTSLAVILPTIEATS